MKAKDQQRGNSRQRRRTQWGRETEREIGIHVGLVLCQARSRGDACVLVSVHQSALHWHISITVGWADMKFCATALHREMRLLAAERFPSTTSANQKRREELYLLPHFTFLHRIPEEQFHIICHPITNWKHSFSFLLKLLPFWTSHVFQQEKLCLRGRKQHGAGVGTTTVLCHTARVCFKNSRFWSQTFWKVDTKWRKEGCSSLFYERLGRGHRHGILKCWLREFCAIWDLL